MPATDREYEIAAWVVSQNAIGQAKHDAPGVSYRRIKDIIEDVFTRLEFERVLQAWSTTEKSDTIFVNIAPDILNAMSIVQRDELKKYWCEKYVEVILVLLEERLRKGESK